MILQPLSQSDTRLRQVCASVSRRDLRTKEQQLEIDALLGYVYGRASYRESGQDGAGMLTPSTVGLSANQVGIMKQICIVDLAIGRPGYHDVRVLVNPRILWASKSMRERVEGCVNFSNWWGITRRPAQVRFEALDRSGFPLRMEVTGWAAAMICHEIDHLNGRLFIDRLAEAGKVHLVTAEDYPRYRRANPRGWDKVIDILREVISD